MKVNGYRQSKLSAAVISALAIGAISAPVSPAAGKPNSLRTPNAIIGTGADAIIGTGADAIIGTGKQKTRSANAIIGTGADAIIGTGADAIIGTGADAIIGTGSQKVGQHSGSSSADLALMGPVTSVNSADGTVAVLGRNFRVPKSSPIFERIADSVTTGEVIQVAVFGKLGGNGELKRPMASVVSGQYVPGVSGVVVSGRIKAIDYATAKIAVGDLIVDYTGTLATRALTLKAGDLVRINGVQHQIGEAVFASELIKLNR